MSEYKNKRHAVYLCTYHMVFVTKYRRPFINNEIGDYMKEELSHLADGLGGCIVSAETDTDHVHVLVSLPPDVSPTSAVISFKTQLSKKVHQNEKFMEYIHRYLYGDVPLWTSSYFIATTGSISMDVVKTYIDGQRSEEHKRKYVHSGKYKKKRPIHPRS